MKKITIIISHYDPGNSIKAKTAFLKTLETLSEQEYTCKLEIIIADDGSYYTPILENSLKKEANEYYQLDKQNIKKLLSDFYNSPKFSNIIDEWIVLPKKQNKMYKPKVLNISASIADGDLIFFLDDDNYFCHNDSIKNIMDLYQKYKIIFGQVIDNNGRKRSYKSSRVQGTTFGIDKAIFNKINGYGEWTIKMSNGVDSDIWWKLFQYSQKNNIRGCYSSSIQTVDVCSKRWKKFTPSILRIWKLKKEFNKKYGCKNYRSKIYNPSRNKTLWLDNLT